MLCRYVVAKVCVLVHCNVRGEAVVYVAVGPEPICTVTQDPFGSRSFCSYDGENGCPEFEYAVHEGDRSIVCRIVGVSFVGFVYKSGGAYTPLLGCVAVSGHEME